MPVTPAAAASTSTPSAAISKPSSPTGAWPDSSRRRKNTARAATGRPCCLREFQRRIVEGGELLAQFQNMFIPVARGVEPGKADGEERVGPAAGQPGTVVENAQGAQRFDQAQFARVEVGKFRITLD